MVIYMGRRRTLHRRVQEAERVGISPPQKPVRVFDPILQKEIEVTTGTPEWTTYLRHVREYKAMQGKERAKGGRTPILQKLGISDEWLWKKYKKIYQQVKDKKETYRRIAELIRENYRDKLERILAKKNRKRLSQGKSKLTIDNLVSPKTIERWFVKHPIPAENISKKTLQETEEYQRFVEKMLERKKDVDTLDNYLNGVFALYDYLKEKYPQIADDSELWTAEHISKFISDKFDEGYSSNTLRGYLVGIRRFLALGVGWTSVDLEKISIESFGKAVEKKKPESIDYFPAQYNDLIIENVPVTTYEVETPSKGKNPTTIRKLVIRSRKDRLMYQSILRTLMCIGARAGGYPTSTEIAQIVRAMDFRKAYDRAFHVFHGIVSLRLEDMFYDEKNKIWRIKRIKEKMGHVWSQGGRGIPLGKKASKTFEDYINARFGWRLHGRELERKIREYVEQKKKEFAQLHKEIQRELKTITSDNMNALRVSQKRTRGQKDPILRKIQKLGNRWIKYYVENMLVYPVDATKISDCIYATFDNAIKNGTPILDQNGHPWTVERIFYEPHTTHLFRKSFAQNMLKRGMPIEVLSDYAVGWSDLSTLKDYYGKTDPSVLDMWFKREIVTMY